MQRIVVMGALVAFWLVQPVQAGDGNFDLGFGTLGVVDTTISVGNIPGLALQPDDRILVAGRAFLPALSPLVARLDSSGAFDATFGAAGIATIAVSGQTNTLAVQPDGGILSAGTAFAAGALLVRFDTNGNPDPSFGSGGVVIEPLANAYGDLALDPAGKVVAFGASITTPQHAFIQRYLLSDGSPDPTFGTGGIRTFSVGPTTLAGGIVRQPDGKLVVAGVYDGLGPVFNFSAYVARFDDAGSPDGAFGTGGVTTFDVAPNSDIFNDVALQPDGRIVATGDSARNVLVARFTAAGALDPTFAGTGYVTVDVGALDSGRNVLVQPDGKIVVVSSTFQTLGDPASGRWVVLRFLEHGTLDPSFGDGGRVVYRPVPGPGLSFAGALQSDGKLVIAGLNGSTTTGPLSLIRLGGDCGDGHVSGLEVCDDGNAVSGDCCDPACQPELALQVCPSTSGCMLHVCDGAGHCGVPDPATGCRASLDPPRSTLVVKQGASNAGAQLVWKYRRGDATSIDDLRNPFVDRDYALCGYGPDLGSGPSLLFELDAPAGLCAGRICWTQLGTSGFSYRNSTRLPTGLEVLRLRSGAARHVSMSAKGRGAHLTLPDLPLALPARVQLRARSGPCWETNFSAAGMRRNDGAQFRGKAN